MCSNQDYLRQQLNQNRIVDQTIGNTAVISSMKSPCKMIVFGKALTDEQLTKFYELVNNVMKVFVK